jgi:hypothetical protein
MSETAVRLLVPEECALLLVDQQAGLAFGVGSIDRQTLLNNVIALARTGSDLCASRGRLDIRRPTHTTGTSREFQSSVTSAGRCVSSGCASASGGSIATH